MSYRNGHSSAEVCGVPSSTRIHLLNGVISELIITCTYEEDVPIHLTTEGYSDPVVAFAPVVSGLSATAHVDTTDDSIIHCIFTVACSSAVSSDVETDVSILISRGTGDTLRTDCVLRGTVEIEAGPLPA
jgi:hypothetical protein